MKEIEFERRQQVINYFIQGALLSSIAEQEGLTVYEVERIIRNEYRYPDLSLGKVQILAQYDYLFILLDEFIRTEDDPRIKLEAIKLKAKVVDRKLETVEGNLTRRNYMRKYMREYREKHGYLAGRDREDYNKYMRGKMREYRAQGKDY